MVVTPLFIPIPEGEFDVVQDLLDNPKYDTGILSVVIDSYTVTSPPVNISIYDIQGQLDASPYDGQIVTTSGIVTGLLPGSSTGYFIQDGAGAWNGVFVYDNVNFPVVGDDITLTALVVEYYELTELKEVAAFAINSSGNTLPEPTILSTFDINAEAFEGVFVRVENAECLNNDYGYGMWQVDDGTGSTLVHNNGSYEYEALIGTSYNVQGILNYGFSEFKIELRMDGDVTVYNGINDILNEEIGLYPNPVSSVLNINSLNNVSSISIINILGEEVFTSFDINSDEISIDMSEFVSGVYIVRILGSNGNSTGYKIIKE